MDQKLKDQLAAAELALLEAETEQEAADARQRIVRALRAGADYDTAAAATAEVQR